MRPDPIELYYAAFETFPETWDLGTVHHTIFPNVTKDFIDAKAQRIANSTGQQVKVEFNYHNDDAKVETYEPKEKP